MDRTFQREFAEAVLKQFHSHSGETPLASAHDIGKLDRQKKLPNFTPAVAARIF
jgi:hypothetical protein